MKRPSMLLAVLGLLIGMALVLALRSSGDDIPIPPAHSAAELAAAADAEVENLVINDLSRRLLTRGLVPGRWQTLRAPARAVWALNTVWNVIGEEGFDGFLANHRRTPTEPGLDEAGEACLAMGLEVPGKLFRTLAGTTDPAAVRRLLGQLQAALATPELRRRRLAYVRGHLEDLADPLRAD